MRSLLLLALPLLALAEPNFKAEKASDHDIEIVRLSDSARGVAVSVVPSIGNRAYELKVHGKNLLYFPADLATLKEKGSFNAIPFLAPWANRIAGGGFWANDKWYTLNAGLKNLNMHAGISMHGMLSTSPYWEVTAMQADQNSAHVTSRLQFWRYPDLMANWPFAQEYVMTYTLTEHGLQVETEVRNLSAEPMPVVIGYHPYFNIPDVPRAEWNIHIAARKHVEAGKDLLATGELTSNTLPDRISLSDHTFDDGFTDLVRDATGNAAFSVEAGSKKIEVVYGPHYGVALVFVPPGQNFMCFEPMAAITNGINLAHDGKYGDLQTVASNATWRESFWIRFSGF